MTRLSHCSTFVADTRNDHAMVMHVESMHFRRLPNNRIQLVGVEFDQSIAHFAQQVVVARVGVVVFIQAASVRLNLHATENSCFHQFAQHAVHGRTTQLTPIDKLLKTLQELLCIKMFVIAADYLKNDALLRGKSLALTAKELDEPLLDSRICFDGW